MDLEPSPDQAIWVKVLRTAGGGEQHRSRDEEVDNHRPLRGVVMVGAAEAAGKNPYASLRMT